MPTHCLTHNSQFFMFPLRGGSHIKPIICLFYSLLSSWYRYNRILFKAISCLFGILHLVEKLVKEISLSNVSTLKSSLSEYFHQQVITKLPVHICLKATQDCPFPILRLFCLDVGCSWSHLSALEVDKETLFLLPFAKFCGGVCGRAGNISNSGSEGLGIQPLPSRCFI